jgi:hypothetical protein
MKTLSSFQKKVIHPLLQSCLIAVIGTCGTAAPGEALPPGVPSRHCSEISNPRPGTLCYVLHDNLGGKATAGGSPQAGELLIQPQAGSYVVDSTAIEVTSQAGNGTHSKGVLAVGASVQSVNGYESRLAEVDRVINELEGEITGVAGPAVYEARNKLTYLRERRAEYSEYYRTAVSASRNAPTTQYTWRARSRKCGALNLDTCGSWIRFRVYEVRRYLGDPIAEYNALLVPAIEQARSAVRNAESNFQRQLYVKNNCSQPIRLALRYRNPADNWETIGWWSFEADEGSYLASNGERIRSNNSVFYYYAEVTTSGADYSWSGDESREFSGRTLPMRKTELSPDSDGNYTLSLSCTNLE